MTPDDRRHGTKAGYSAHQADGETPCQACRDGKNAYMRHVTKQKAYGRWNPYVDAQPARDHVRTLMAQGVSIKRIAAAADVMPTRVSYLLYGRGQRNQPTQIRPDFADAILAVNATPRTSSPLGVRRRLQALAAIGYAQPHLARHLGTSQGTLWMLMHDRYRYNVTQEFQHRVATLYDRLCMTLPETNTRAQKFSVSRSKETATRNGWLPPLAWDHIDDPDENPAQPTPKARADRRRSTDIDENNVLRAIAGDRVKLTTAERVETVRRLRDEGWTYNRIERDTVISKPERYINWRKGYAATDTEDAA